MKNFKSLFALLLLAVLTIAFSPPGYTAAAAVPTDLAYNVGTNTPVNFEAATLDNDYQMQAYANEQTFVYCQVTVETSARDCVLLNARQYTFDALNKFTYSKRTCSVDNKKLIATKANKPPFHSPREDI